MKKILDISAKAKSDLRGIHQYIQQDSIEESRRFIEDFAAKIEWIVEVDFTGSPRDYIAKGLRALPYRKRCIYYRSYSERVVILRVLHGAQDVTRQEFEEK